jgi:30S ribosomal protein S31
MGKGDKKTRKGKIFMGSYGLTRPRKGKKSTTVNSAASESAGANVTSGKKNKAKNGKKDE